METFVFVTIGAFLGGFVNGFAGFGIALFALGWFLQVMAPLEAVALTLAAGVATGAPGLLVVWRRMEPWLLARFMLPALVGIPFGTALLAFVSARTLVAFVAVLLIGYGAFTLARANMPRLTGDRPVTDTGVGFLGGVMGGMAGLSGVAPTIWLSMRDWSKGRTRGLLQPFNTVILLMSAVAVALRGGYTGETLVHIGLGLPGMATGFGAGLFFYRRVGDGGFRRALVALMLLSGFALVVQLALD